MPSVVVLAALFAVVFWGGSPVGTKLAVSEIPPVAMSALRCFIAAPVGLVLALLLRVPLPRTKREAALLLLCAFCAFVGFPVVYSYGVRRTSAIHAAMILAMLPVFTGAIANLFERRWPALRWWSGCAIAVTGEALLVSGRASGGASLFGDAFVLASATVASVGYVVGARLSQAGYPSQGTTYWGMVAGSLAFLPAYPFVAGDVAWTTISLQAWGGLVYLALGVSMLGYVIWYWALGKGGIARIGVLQFLQPVSGVVLARLLLGEAVTATSLTASAIVLGGVFVATRR
jgi:drug/metabolite transporter (DMT)-like permease